MKRQLHLCYTSDTHGHVFPVEYGTNTPSACGLLNLAAAYHKDGNTLVLDGGDTLQGTPFSQYYLDHAPQWPFHPIAMAMNAAGYDYVTLGNHDFNYGYNPLRNYLRALNAQCLCANVQDLRGELPLKATAVTTLANGLRVGLVGIVTDYVNVWEQPANLTELKITDAFTAAKEALKVLRPACDICVCIYHGGFEKDLETGRVLSESGENIAVRLCEELGYDLVLTGHQHMPVESVQLGGTHAVQPPAGAGRYCAITAEEEQGRVQIISQFQPAGSQHPDEPYNTLLPLEEAVQQWLDLPVGRLSEPVPPEAKLKAALTGSRVAALFNQVQLAATGADFACTSLGNEPVGLAAEVTVRGITAAYLFPNTLVVLQVTQQDLKEALERCAAYFALQEGQPCIAEEFLKPKIEHYNYDFYAGLSYTFDLRRPVGQRVVALCRADGRPLGQGPFRLCTSNYRATGTGGYEVLSRCKVLWRGTEEMPQLVAEYLQRNTPLPPLAKNGPVVVWQPGPTV